MKYYFYNSFSLSGDGYSIAELTKEGVRIPETISPYVKQYFYNGGLNLIISYFPSSEERCICVKGVEEINMQKKLDEKGRKVFLNYAFVADKTEKDIFEKFVNYILLNYHTFHQSLLRQLSIPANNIFGYQIDFAAFSSLIKETVKRKMEVISFKDILAGLPAMTQSENYFAVLPRDWKYYVEMCEKDKPSHAPKYSMTENEFKRIITAQTNSDDMKTEPTEKKDAPSSSQEDTNVQDVIKENQELKAELNKVRDDYATAVNDHKRELWEQEQAQRKAMLKTIGISAAIGAVLGITVTLLCK